MSGKHRWLMTKRLDNIKLSKKEIEALGCIVALSHIKPKFIRRQIELFTDSSYIYSMLDSNKKGFKRPHTSVPLMEILRGMVLRYSDFQIKRMNDKDDNKEELLHVYQECGLDKLELTEISP